MRIQKTVLENIIKKTVINVTRKYVFIILDLAIKVCKYDNL